MLALDRASEFHEIACLITLCSSNPESYMFHTVGIEHTRVQAEAMALPHIMEGTRGVKEEELGDLRKALTKAMQEYGIEGVVSGAIASIYQASRVQRVCHELGLTSFNPLWQEAQERVLRELQEKKYRVMITGVFAYPLGEEYLGRILDQRTIEELLQLEEKMGFNPAGEGGEIETFVLDGPVFKRRVEAQIIKRTYSNYSGSVELRTEMAP